MALAPRRNATPINIQAESQIRGYRLTVISTARFSAAAVGAPNLRHAGYSFPDTTDSFRRRTRPSVLSQAGIGTGHEPADGRVNQCAGPASDQQTFRLTRLKSIPADWGTERSTPPPLTLERINKFVSDTRPMSSIRTNMAVEYRVFLTASVHLRCMSRHLPDR